ncbi:MAG: DUF4129 domain-containing protein [Thermodesulfobacteriota bacterium]
MSKERGKLIFLAHGGMEFTWLYAWAAFLMVSIVGRPYPLPEAICAFVLGAVLTLAIRGMGLRVISVLGLQVAGFLLVSSRIVYILNYQAYPYVGKAWLAAFVTRPRDPLEWVVLVLVLIFALIFWVSGMTFVRRPSAYLSICARFDLGVGAFFCLLLIRFLLLVKGGMELRDFAPEFLMFPFFIFGLLAIGLARNSSKARKDFLEGYRGIGLLASFIIVVLAFGTGLVLLFMPYLRVAAEAGYEVLKSAAGPLSPLVVKILQFLFIGRKIRTEPSSTSAGGDEKEFISPGEGGWWNEVLGKVAEWGFLALGVLIGIALCALGMRYLVRWLFSRTPQDHRGHIRWRLLGIWARNVWAGFTVGLNSAMERLKGCRNAIQLYRALLRWGRRSGLPHLSSETPAEYGNRLAQQFPTLTGEIEKIVNAFNLVVYGGRSLEDERITLVKFAWKRLRSPRYWPVRLKSWFFQPGRP